MSLTAEETAELINETVPTIEQERGRRTTRFQLSLVSISKICKRNIVDTVFLNNLASELLNMGWCMFQVENTRWGFIKKKSVESWVKFSSKRFV